MSAHGAIIRAGVGFIYPSYKSLQAVMTDEKEDDLTWLRYWVVLSVVSMIELVVDPIVDFFPGYLLAKCAFLIWCMAPIQNNGANLIFTQVITIYINCWNRHFCLIILPLPLFFSALYSIRSFSHCSRSTMRR